MGDQIEALEDVTPWSGPLTAAEVAMIDCAWDKHKMAKAEADTERFCSELDITNADHIKLWLESNIDDCSLTWMAVHFAEAHRAAIGKAEQ